MYCMYMYIYIYIYIGIKCVYIYIYIYTHKRCATITLQRDGPCRSHKPSPTNLKSNKYDILLKHKNTKENNTKLVHLKKTYKKRNSILVRGVEAPQKVLSRGASHQAREHLGKKNIKGSCGLC